MAWDGVSALSEENSEQWNATTSGIDSMQQKDGDNVKKRREAVKMTPVIISDLVDRMRLEEVIVWHLGCVCRAD